MSDIGVFSGGSRRRPSLSGRHRLKEADGQALFPLRDDERRQDDDAAAGVVQLPRARHAHDAVRRRPLPQGRQGQISSRIGLEADAEIFRDGDDLFARIAAHHEHTTVHCVFVDEAQFLDEEQVWQLARVADRLDIPVMCYGLRTDFQGKLFPGSRALLAIADELREVRTICRCGRKATMVVRLGADGKVARQGEQVAIGKDIYVSLCRRHWEEEMGRIAPDDFIHRHHPVAVHVGGALVQSARLDA